MSKRHLRQVCERHSVILVERDVSLKACLWLYPQPGDNRWCRRKDNPGNHPGAGWQCGEVTVEREHTGAEGSSGRVWAGSSAHVPSFKPCFCLPDAPASPPSTCHCLPPQSFSTCRASSSRSPLTGPSCVRILWPTALFDFVFVFLCACMCLHLFAMRGGGGSLFSWRLKGLIFVAGLSDLCSLHARSMPAPSKWQRLMRATHPLTGARYDREYVLPNSKLVATEWRTHRAALSLHRNAFCSKWWQTEDGRYRGLEVCQLLCQHNYLVHLRIIYLFMCTVWLGDVIYKENRLLITFLNL